MKKAIVIIGTLDTKGEEILFIRNIMREHYINSIVIDSGILGTPFFNSDITREQVVKKVGSCLIKLLKSNNKGLAIKTMAAGSRAIINELYNNKKIDGIIAVGGGQGTFIGTFSMRDLPLGFPKVMVTTIGSSNMRPFIGTKDIVTFNSVVDIFGINSVSKIILENSANALIGMVQYRRPIIQKDKKFKIGATAFGTTTIGLTKIKKYYKSQGYDFIPFHANGVGGQAMEEMAGNGFLGAIFDWSTHEITDEICKGIFSAGSDRMDIISKKKIPYLFTPGGIDYIVFGQSFLNSNKKLRKHIIHNDNIILVRTNKIEMQKIAIFIARKINKSCGPVRVVIPLKGFSEEDKINREFYEPETDYVFIKTLKEHLSPNIIVKEIDAHINDSYFVESCILIFNEILNI